MSRWPPIKFPHVYTYLIDTPGEFTREKLKAFKSRHWYYLWSLPWQPQCDPKAAIFTVVPGYPVPVPTCTLSKSACAIEPELPPKLTSYYAAKYMSCTVSQVLRLSRFKLSTIKCSKEQSVQLGTGTGYPGTTCKYCCLWVGFV